MVDLIPWKQKTLIKDKIDKQIENTRINYCFPRDSAPTHFTVRQDKSVSANMKKWQGTGKRRLLEAFLKSCSLNYTRTKQSIPIPNQESHFCKRSQPNSSFFMPCCSHVFQFSLDRKGSDVFPSTRCCVCCNRCTGRQFVLGLGALIFNIFVALVYKGLQWFQNAFKLAKWLSCLVEVKPTGSKLYGCFLYFERIFSGDTFLYREMGGFFRLSVKPFQNS